MKLLSIFLLFCAVIAGCNQQPRSTDWKGHVSYSLTANEAKLEMQLDSSRSIRLSQLSYLKADSCHRSFLFSIPPDTAVKYSRLLIEFYQLPTLSEEEGYGISPSPRELIVDIHSCLKGTYQFAAITKLVGGEKDTIHYAYTIPESQVCGAKERDAESNYSRVYNQDSVLIQSSDTLFPLGDTIQLEVTYTGKRRVKGGVFRVISPDAENLTIPVLRVFCGGRTSYRFIPRTSGKYWVGYSFSHPQNINTNGQFPLQVQ